MVLKFSRRKIMDIKKWLEQIYSIKYTQVAVKKGYPFFFDDLWVLFLHPQGLARLRLQTHVVPGLDLPGHCLTTAIRFTKCAFNWTICGKTMENWNWQNIGQKCHFLTPCAPFFHLIAFYVIKEVHCLVNPKCPLQHPRFDPNWQTYPFGLLLIAWSSDPGKFWAKNLFPKVKMGSTCNTRG